MEVGATSAKVAGIIVIILLLAQNLDILHQVSNYILQKNLTFIH